MSGKREGLILEKPLIMGENGRNDDDGETRLDIDHEINLASNSSTATSNYELTKDIKRLGMERLHLFFIFLILFKYNLICVQMPYLRVIFMHAHQISLPILKCITYY